MYECGRSAVLHRFFLIRFHDTLDLGPRTLDLGPWTSDLGPWTSDLGLRTLDLGLRTSDLGPWTSDLGPWTSDLGPWTRAVQRQYLPTRPSIMYLRIYTPRYLCIIMYIGGVSIGRILVYFRQLSALAGPYNFEFRNSRDARFA
jgi:hypothetical protein